MNAADCLLDILGAEGVDRIFGNPGTTELPLMDAIGKRDDFQYVLALHESAAVAMADGYARASGSTAFVNLHIAGGLANGLSNLLNAARSRTPMVVVAGQQDRRHLAHDPMLTGDLVGLAKPVCKTAVEVGRAEDMPRAVHRAFRAAQAAPQGPSFVSIPVDLLEEEVAVDASSLASSDVDPVGAAEGIAKAAQMLAEARSLVVIAGDQIGREDALQEVVTVAECLGADVYQEPMYDVVGFPSTHTLCRGTLPQSHDEIEATLRRYDVAFLVGIPAFRPLLYTQPNAVPEGTQLTQLDSAAEVVGRNYPVEIGLVGGIKPTLAALAAELEPTVTGPRSRNAADSSGHPLAQEAGADDNGDASDDPISDWDGVMSPEQAMWALTEHLPADAIVIEEALTAAPALRKYLRPSQPGRFHHTLGGSLGWGLGAAVGVALAEPNAPVVAVVGDGSAIFGLQALWSAAHEEAAVLFVVVNNGEYRVLKEYTERMRAGRSDGSYLGMTLSRPTIGWADLASGFGVDAARVESERELGAALTKALALRRPTLIDLVVTPWHGGGAEFQGQEEVQWQSS